MLLECSVFAFCDGGMPENRCMRSRHLLVLLILFCGLAAVGWAARPSLHQVEQAVNGRYNHAQSMRAAFTETYSISGDRQVESGVLWLRKPGRMRWEYQQPRPKLFLVDGKRQWLYIPGQDTVEVGSLKQMDDYRNPLRFLLGHTNLAKELTNLHFSNTPALRPGDWVLEGIPKAYKNEYRSVRLEISPDYKIRAITLRMVDGSQIEIVFSSIQYNPPLRSDLFRMKLPAGVREVPFSQG